MFKLTVIGCVVAATTSMTIQAFGGVICSGESTAMRMNSPVPGSDNGVLTIYASTRDVDVPQIRNVRAFQQYPWGSKIYITYEVVGNVVASADGGTTPILVVRAKDNATGCEYEATLLSGDTGTEAGLHRIVWDVEAQGVTVNSTNVTISVRYINNVYLIVDLSAGANASSYPVSYLSVVPSSGWTDDYKTTKLVLRLITAGTYKMQNTSNVTLTKPFYMGIFEVTQKQWELVMGSNPCSSTSYGKGDNYPVHYVSYDMIRGSSNGAEWPLSSAVDSDSFMGKLLARTGLNFDLPTDAQWEYACRAGTTTTYYWGDSMNDNYAWHSGNSIKTSHTVGTMTPNAWGLYDMSGNVWEWCLDWYYKTLSYGTDPKGPSSNDSSGWGGRVFRGGSWDHHAGDCTSSFRWGYPAYDSAYAGRSGFRLVRTLSD